MKAIVIEDVCIGCGLCESNCPEVFEMDGPMAKVKVEIIPEDAKECALKMAKDCPVEAIQIE